MLVLTCKRAIYFTYHTSSQFLRENNDIIHPNALWVPVFVFMAANSQVVVLCYVRFLEDVYHLFTEKI